MGGQGQLNLLRCLWMLVGGKQNGVNNAFVGCLSVRLTQVPIGIKRVASTDRKDVAEY